jgi:hypothetical protein
MPLAYVAWRAGTKHIGLFVPVRQAGNRFLGSLQGLQIRAQQSKHLHISLSQGNWGGGGGGGVLEPNMATVKKLELIEEVITRGTQIVFFFVPTNLSNHMDRQARTRDTALVKSKERTLGVG